MNKFVEFFAELNQKLKNPSEELKILGLFVLVIIGFAINTWIAIVEDEHFFLILYCGITYLLYKFSYKLSFKTIATIIIIETVITYLLMILALPELMHLHT